MAFVRKSYDTLRAAPCPYVFATIPNSLAVYRLPGFPNRIAAVLVSEEPIMMLRVRQPLVASASRGYLAKGRRSASSVDSGPDRGSVFDNVLVERKERVGVIQLNRPKVTAWSFL